MAVLTVPIFPNLEKLRSANPNVKQRSGLTAVCMALLIGAIWHTRSPGEHLGSPQPAATAQVADQDRLVVHEWGTFTALQDERGIAIGGINSDDEPVPDFVHGVGKEFLLGPGLERRILLEDVPLSRKGVPLCHPDVRMRLETPVLYFHPPARWNEPFQIDVEVGFRGGWLTEYYPDAVAAAPGIDETRRVFGSLTPQAVGTLSWNDLTVGVTDTEGPQTSSHIWLAPRAVNAAMVQSRSGESEKYLFYRGVGNLGTPLKVVRLANQTLGIYSSFPHIPAVASHEIKAAWLVDIRGETAAFRGLPPLTATAEPKLLTTTSGRFRQEEYTPGNLVRLRQSMHQALVTDGLFPDEAAAMLNTWEDSYFRSSGLRLFFLVPQAWTDLVLPLKLSIPADVTRTMVGRIEIVTPEQRKTLQRISNLERPEWTPRTLTSFLLARAPHNRQALVDVGRFRHALLLDEARRRPTEALRAFMAKYGVQAYEVND